MGMRPERQIILLLSTDTPALAPAIWNDIPAGIREAEHIESFKVKLKKKLEVGS